MNCIPQRYTSINFSSILFIWHSQWFLQPMSSKSNITEYRCEPIVSKPKATEGRKSFQKLDEDVQSLNPPRDKLNVSYSKYPQAWPGTLDIVPSTIICSCGCRSNRYLTQNAYKTSKTKNVLIMDTPQHMP